jgi:hypothetical protein
MERPPHAVFAWDLFSVLPPERWFAERDYLSCALHLFEGMVNGTFTKSWPRAKAAGFLYAHGLELFLKAAIAQAQLKVPRTHDLKKLLARFDSVYSGPAFSLETDIAGFIRENEKLPFANFLKYPEVIADVGKTWDGSVYIDVREWAAHAARACSRVVLLWEHILEKYPRNLDFWFGRVDVELE